MKLTLSLGLEVNKQVENLIAKDRTLTKCRLAHLLGQCSVESLHFTKTRENMNYSAVGLMNTFPSYFKNTLEAQKYERNAVKIANYVYANREGNGPPESNDGWNYRGGGYLGLTFKNNYTDFFHSIGLPKDSNPELVATTYALESAHYFFTKNGIYFIADKGLDESTCKLVTRKINKGDFDLIQLDNRIKCTLNVFNHLV